MDVNNIIKISQPLHLQEVFFMFELETTFFMSQTYSYFTCTELHNINTENNILLS